MTSSALWRTRYQAAMAEMTKYTRYMANGGLLFTVYFVVLYGLVVYGRFLDQIDPDFPGHLLMGGLFILLAFYRSARTFLVEADQVFLLPSLPRLDGYMKRVRVYNALYGMIRVILPFLAVSVLYVRTEQTTAGELILLFVSLGMIGAAANLSKLEGISHRIVLLYATGAGVLVMLDMGSFSIVVTSLLLLTLHLKKQEQLPLMEWITLEQESRDRFYRIANWFVDVPRLSTTYKRRRLLSHLVEKIGFDQKRTFDYLYMKQFIRSTDGIGLIVRLTLIGAVFMWLAKDSGWLVTLAIPAFSGLTSFQLAPFTRAIDSHLLTRLLPFGDAVSSKRKVIRVASFLQVMVLTLAGVILSGEVTVFVGAIVALGIGEYYARKK
ncbi:MULTISPECIES: ABC transporter permease [Exiguobacterium]|uniref:ABC transporter permease n=1 Tax=Exiguobacterium antarcticum TaxID=132920 RepID=A0ABT6R3U5_9BACL|nr:MULTISPECIES: ABC transporter permease [Exiguobacterium]AFS69817.1 ABC transporter EcsB [Exiguobacterium antarcticum B7]MCT4780351.1 ABC transporter permease [Exiguobacterium soli]MDI3235610.1 ABC transporter permease [Exiguobacterium antarcticum]